MQERFAGMVRLACWIAAFASAPPGLADIAKAGTSLAPAFKPHNGQTVAVKATVRQQSDKETVQVLERQRQKLLGAMRRTAFTSVDDPSAAQYALELVDAPTMRYGLYHYDYSFYAFLLLRDNQSGRLLYCAFRRAGFLHSATDSLLHDFIAATQGHPALTQVSMQECAALAGRPV